MKSIKRSDVREEVQHWCTCPCCDEDTSLDSEENNTVICDTCGCHFEIENH